MRRIAAALGHLAGWRADLAALGAGLVAALALPPVHAIPALLLAFPALLALLAGTRTPWGAARRGFWFGFGLHLVGLYWITEAILLESARYWWFVPIAVPSLSALLALFIAAPCAVARAVPAGWGRVAALAGGWVLFDLARQFVGTGFPWNPLGSVWAVPGGFGDVMLQPSAWVGTPGLTLATVIVAALPSLGRRGWVLGALVVAGWAAASMGRLAEPEPATTGLVVVLVQGNVAHGTLRTIEDARAAFTRQLRLSAEGVAGAAGRPTVVVWSEGAADPFFLDEDNGARPALVEAIRPSLGAIVGSLRFGSGTRDTPPFNSEFALAANGAITGIYDKWHLVPFGEFAPSWVPLSIQIVPGVFAFGSGPKTLRIPGVPAFGGLICYEVIYPAQVVDEADRPDWLVNVTNDAWFGNSTGPRQHLAGARMRAVEEGLPLMRAANTGITAGFDSRGRELGRLGVGVEGELSLPLPGKRAPTPFSRFGLILPGVLAFLLLFGGAFNRFRAIFTRG